MKKVLWIVLAVCSMGLHVGCGSSGDTQPNCATGTEYAEPGCGENNKFTAGCFTPCTKNSDCDEKSECKTVSIKPACATAPQGDAVCNACGQQKSFCMAKDSTTPTQCAAGEEHHTPGCGDTKPAIQAGCFKPCKADTDCDSGKTCQDTSVTPSCAKNADPNGVVCGACGETIKLCR